MNTLDLFEAVNRRDTAIAKAKDSAERISPGWNDQAYRAFLDYREKVLFQWDNPLFTAEDIRAFAASIGVEAPATSRAWGAVMRRAKAAGLIEPTDRFAAATSPKAHCRPNRLWKAVA